MPLPGQSPIINITKLVMTITVNEIDGTMTCLTNRPIPHLQAIAILATVINGQVEDSLKVAAGGISKLMNPANNPASNPGGNTGGGSAH